jgi:serine/threonine protein kinase
MNILDYEIILSNKNNTTELIEEMKLLKIDKEIVDKRVAIYKKENFVVKYINKYEIYPNKNAEFIIVEDVINKKFVNPHLIDMHAMIKFNYTKKLTQILVKKKDISPHITKKIKLEDEEHDNFGFIMPIYETLSEYLQKNNDIDPKLLLSNILGILDLCIDIRDTYNFYHKDIKIDNILIKNNRFYLIDWEFIIEKGSIYFSDERPTQGNTEMYPFYNATGEQFLIHSIGVLITRIIGFNYNVTYDDFMKNYAIEYILSNIPEEKTELYEKLLLNIYDKKYQKIEKLKDDISIILDKVK